MFNDVPEVAKVLDEGGVEKPITLSFAEAMIFSGLDRAALYDLLTANRLRRTGGIDVARLTRAIERGGER